MKDVRLIDLVAAVLTGILLFAIDLWKWSLFFIEIPLQFIIGRALTWIGMFIVVALILFPWKHKLRAQSGWVVIALLGLTTVAGTHEMIARANDPDEHLFPAYYFFPREICQ